MAKPKTQLATASEEWELLERKLSGEASELSGDKLRIADVVAATHNEHILLLSQDPHVLQRIDDSVTTVSKHLKTGKHVYGVTTGFGGSADTRTSKTIALQGSLMQLLHAGILTTADIGSGIDAEAAMDLDTRAMPSAWVRATIAVRCNTLLRGHSAVSLPVLQALARLLEKNITPVVPLRGTISASGDLMPLAYIAGAIEGNPDIYVRMLGSARVLSASEALREAKIEPVSFGPKEGLGLVNGTAASAALGALVMHDVHHLSILTQALAAMAVEALQGTTESFHPFIAASRPHPGQIEVARNITSFLNGSALARSEKEREGLIQDRYSIRTAPQWLGPQVEDVLLAHQQIAMELNSTTDNPLVDNASGRILNGGNFQAAAVTSATEKVRLSLQMFGRIIFCQLSEIVNPALSNGLPPNLASDDPSLSFMMKGVEISMAGYMAELSWLAHPMSAHIQPAEMQNQSINSMAFASARKSMDAVDILSMMCANGIYGCCQALDLRVMHNNFLAKAKEVIVRLTKRHFSTRLNRTRLDDLQSLLVQDTESCWNSLSKLDLHDRCHQVAVSLSRHFLDLVTSSGGTDRAKLAWRDEAVTLLREAWDGVCATFREQQDTAQFLGAAAKAIYLFVRNDLGVPFHQGFIEHPTTNNDSLHGRRKRTVGGWISMIHESIRDGRLYAVLMRLAKTMEADGLKNNLDAVEGVTTIRAKL